MNESTPILAVDMSFRSRADIPLWEAALHSLIEVDPGFDPARLERHRLEPGEPEPWSDAFIPELARLCSTSTPTMWRVFREGDSRSLTVSANQNEVKLTLTLPSPGEPTARFLEVIDACPSDLRPVLATGFEPSSADDTELLLQGLDGLRQVPPLLYLDCAAVERLGRASLESSPCEVRRLDHGAVLLVTRAAPLEPPTEADIVASKQIAQALKIDRRLCA
jgi:hypothetical protein